MIFIYQITIKLFFNNDTFGDNKDEIIDKLRMISIDNITMKYIVITYYKW